MGLEGTEYQLGENQGLCAARGKHTMQVSQHQLLCAWGAVYNFRERRGCVNLPGVLVLGLLIRVLVREQTATRLGSHQGLQSISGPGASCLAYENS